MRLPPLLRLRVGRRPSFGRIASGVIELWLIALSVQMLEFVGRATFDDAADVVGVLLLLLLGMLLTGAAKAGRAPVTAFLAGGAVQRVRSWVRTLEPAAGVAFRLPTEPLPVRWTPRKATLLALGALTLLTLLVGPFLLTGLAWVRVHVAYTPYLVGLVALWGLFGFVTTLGLVAIKNVARIDRARTSLARSLRWLPWLAGWVLAIVAFGALPGWAVLLVFLAVAVVTGRPMLRRPPRPYWLWRRDEEGRVRYATVLSWLRATWIATALLLFGVALLATLPRFLVAAPPVGRFGITVGLGLAATAASLVLLGHAGRFLARTLPRPGEAPEAALEPTLWWPGGGDAPWREPAEGEGWRVVTSERPPPDGYDLSIGVPGDRHGVEVPETFGRDDARFRLHRRFHVVKRRQFFRRLRTLHKDITKPPGVPGVGYLLCPAAWPVPAVIRDGATAGEEGRAVLGGMQVGRPYAEVFPLRVRRYLADVLATLEIDLVYWEDRVGWAPLRAALGVLFETYDQGRHPAQERHFIGLQRVKAVIQEAEDVDELLADPLRVPGDGPPPLRARVLVLRRDDGGQEEETPVFQPGDHLPVGSSA